VLVDHDANLRLEESFNSWLVETTFEHVLDVGHPSASICIFFFLRRSKPSSYIRCQIRKKDELAFVFIAVSTCMHVRLTL
jgi:hypothetical protein